MSKTTNKMITTISLSLVGSLSLVSMTVLSGILLSSPVVSAEDIVDEINITVPSSCSLSGTNLIHTANMENGQYKDNIGSANISAFCNDPNGFSIYAIGYTEDTYGNNKMHDPNLDTTHDINTGKYVSGTTTNSTWSMKLTPVTGPYAPTIRNDSTYNYTNYEVVPSEYTKVAYSSAATETGDGATGSNFTTSYAIFVSQSQNAGSYTGKVKFTLVHPENETPAQPQPCEAGKICYHANTTNVQGQMGKQSALNNKSATLYAPNFKRNGYGFAGWNTSFDYSGTNYGPNQTITAPADVQTNGLSLYARWVPSQGTLQNWNGCSSMSIGDVTALTDNRDNDTYAVAKLADNKCWMIENLRLDDSAELSSANTHNPSLPLTNVYDSSTTSNHLSPTSSLTYNPTTAPEGWCNTDSHACDDQSRLRTDNTKLFINNTSSSYDATSNVYSYGNYYNWYSATVGHGKYGLSYGYDYIIPGDICPLGWHLPTGGSASAEFGVLDVSIGGTGKSQTSSAASNRWRSYPNNYVYSGHVDGSSNRLRNTDGYYWSSMISYNGNVRSLYFYSTQVDPNSYSNGNYHGWSVRCIAGV